MAPGDEDDSVSYDVVEKVSARAGVDPMELRPRLADVVDPEALSRLFPDHDDGPDNSIGRVEFRYCGYDVTVFSDGRVEVRE